MGTFNNPRRNWRNRSEFCGGPLRPVFGLSEGRSAKPDHKTAALCKQVRRALSLALSGQCADPILQDLIVDEVLPAPNAGRLLVRVMLHAPNPGETGPGIIDILQRLAAVEGLLRACIAESIARKRTPELAFVVIPFTVPQTGTLQDEEPPNA